MERVRASPRVRRASPLSTRPGPISVYAPTGWRAAVRSTSTQWTGLVSWRRNSSLASSPEPM